MSDSFFDKYTVEGQIGEGTFSEVLKCSEKSTGSIVAAKRLKKYIKSKEEALQLSEIRALRSLSVHPNVLPLLESHVDLMRGSVTLVFELMDKSLHDALREVKRPWEESKCKRYIYQIMKGVEHIHSHGLFHRDIKPENILMKGETLKISDLGCARPFLPGPPYTGYVSTRWYRSPECLLSPGFYGPKMDVWAIGCVFFELLTLNPLFPGQNELDQINKINSVLGTPNPRLFCKFKRHRSRSKSGFRFQVKTGTGLPPLLPHNTQRCKEIIKEMIVYDPDSRSNLKRLLESKYFDEIRSEYRERESELRNEKEMRLFRNATALGLLDSRGRSFGREIIRKTTQVDMGNGEKEEKGKKRRINSRFIKSSNGHWSGTGEERFPSISQFMGGAEELEIGKKRVLRNETNGTDKVGDTSPLSDFRNSVVAPGPPQWPRGMKKLVVPASSFHF